MQFQFLSACRPFAGADLVTETRSKGPGKEICVSGVDYLDIGHPTAKKTPRLDLELPEELRKDFSAHTDTLQKIFSTGFWKNDTQVKHTELKILFRKMKNSVIDSKARNTTVKYAYSFKRFVVWSEKYTEIKFVLPANEIYVSLYLQYLMQSAKHYSTIEAACYAIKWAHSLAGFEDPCASDIVKCIVEASKRKLNRPIQKKNR
ncbi:unnamed protein product [Mytilus coruscus]|uniref:Core-binding (CB) domain-containing protein n=1 Tax=Mytilus coruscus TaxID=42192 RepID=A0A6J8CYY5_MYTCO|nr:unnamed protein product [Mytilus coruscus]